MGVIDRFFGQSPFILLHEHTKKVHECVKLLRPLSEALLAENYDKIEELHNLMSKTEHEADQIKTDLRDKIAELYFLSVGKEEISRFLTYQDDVADAAEDFAVLLLLRKTKIPVDLKEEFSELINQIIHVSEQLLRMAENLSTVANSAFTGKEAQDILQAVDTIGQEEWKADRMERKFARHIYDIEDKLDPVTIMFLDKYCKTLSKVANNAEKTAKYLRLMIRNK